MELAEWGWNAVTFGFVGTLVLGILGIISLWTQNRRIWRLKSGVSVPVSINMYMLASLTSGLMYGIVSGRLALIIPVLMRGPLLIAVLVGLKRFRGFTRVDMVFGWFLAAVLVFMLPSERKDLFFLAFMFGLIPLCLVQPWELWRNKSSGAADPVMLWMFVFGTSAWTIYWWATGGVLMTWVNLVLLVIAAATLVLYYRYRK